MRDELRKQREERRTRRESMGEQFLDHAVQEFADSAGLSDQQVAALYPRLQKMREDQRANWRKMRNGEIDLTELKANASQARADLDEEARRVLDDEQFGLYKKELDRRMSGRGGWRGL